MAILDTLKPDQPAPATERKVRAATAAGHRPTRLVVGTTLLVILMCLCIVVIDGAQIVKARSAQLRETGITTANLSRSLAQHAQVASTQRLS